MPAVATLRGVAAVAVKVVTATGNVEVEELQKNCREFEGG